MPRLVKIYHTKTEAKKAADFLRKRGVKVRIVNATYTGIGTIKKKHKGYQLVKY